MMTTNRALRVGVLAGLTFALTATFATPAASAVEVAAVPAAVTAAGPTVHTAVTALDGRLTRNPDDHAYRDRYAATTPVAVVCKSVGTTGYRDPTWALTTDHLWVAGQYLAHAGGQRGVAPSVPTCTIPLKARALDDLNSRRSKSMGDVDVVDRYRKSQAVPVVCTALGGPTGPGLHTWARTADRNWVPARYLDLKLARDGMAAALPRCDKEGARKAAGGGSKPSARRDGRTWTISDKGVAFVAGEEGFGHAGRHYNDPSSPPNCTVGYGHLVHRGPCTRRELGKPAISRAVALGLLRSELMGRYRDQTGQVLSGVPVNQHEYDAIASMVYNMGPGALLRYRGRPTEFVTALRSGPRAYPTIPDRMLNFSTVSGKFSCGLNKRRQREGRIFSSGDYDASKVTVCVRR
ncbi:hypothetical protein WDV85_05150 [Pseudokineococcus sp. 5B2Z-1]|uniref:glycoside hydrolase family protein n=1 Tax=Pseudokineococcus sp. 5B2Z-1 TaxID=3132744 RepID=UPI00309E39C0